MPPSAFREKSTPSGDSRRVRAHGAPRRASQSLPAAAARAVVAVRTPRNLHRAGRSAVWDSSAHDRQRESRPVAPCARHGTMRLSTAVRMACQASPKSEGADSDAGRRAANDGGRPTIAPSVTARSPYDHRPAAATGTRAPTGPAAADARFTVRSPRGCRPSRRRPSAAMSTAARASRASLSATAGPLFRCALRQHRVAPWRSRSARRRPRAPPRSRSRQRGSQIAALWQLASASAACFPRSALCSGPRVLWRSPIRVSSHSGRRHSPCAFVTSRAGRAVGANPSGVARRGALLTDRGRRHLLAGQVLDDSERPGRRVSLRVARVTRVPGDGSGFRAHGAPRAQRY